MKHLFLSVFLLCSTLCAQTNNFALRINVGGPAYKDANGNSWVADELYYGGTAYTVTDPIGGADPAIYQSERYSINGNFGYSIGVPNGTYTITLKLAETYYTAAGSRQFSAIINNQQVLTNYDIYAAAGGKDIAVDQQFTGIAVTNGVLNVLLSQGTGAGDHTPLLGGLEIVQTAGPASTPSANTSNTQAISANTFLNSLGINTHLSQGYSETNYVSPIQYLGIKNFRDGTDKLDAVAKLHAETGAKADLIVDCSNVQADTNNVLPYINQYVAQTGALLAIEGPNEPNNFPTTYYGQTGGGSGSWLPVAQCQASLYNQVKLGPLNGFPVWSVTLGGAQTANVGLQYLQVPTGSNLASIPDNTVYADAANIHNYVSSNDNTLDEDNQAWLAADSQNNAFPGDKLYNEFGLTFLNGYAGYDSAGLASLAKVTTETGWDTTGNPGGEIVQGQMLTNVLLDQFKRGWSYTFLYELIDGEGGNSTQGLYHADYTPKIAATYIHNLTTILADTETITNPGTVNYSIPNEPVTVHDLLLEKADGTYSLVVWDERANTSDNVSVNLGGTASWVSVYDITSGTSAIQTLTNVSSVPLTLSNHAMILSFAAPVNTNLVPPPVNPQSSCTITPATPTGGTVGAAYSQAFSNSGCTSSSYVLSSGAMPSGLSLSTDGTVSGTPSAAGTFTFTVAYDTGSQLETLTIAPSPTMTPQSVLLGSKNTSNSDNLLTIVGTTENRGGEGLEFHVDYLPQSYGIRLHPEDSGAGGILLRLEGQDQFGVWHPEVEWGNGYNTFNPATHVFGDLNVDGVVRSNSPANTDLTGELSFSNSLTATYTLTRAYASHPECLVTPQFDTSGLVPWVTYSGNSVTVNFSAAVTGIVSYVCIGRN